MRGFVKPTVDAVLEHLDGRGLLALDPEPDTFSTSVPFDTAIRRAMYVADLLGTTVRIVYRGVPVEARVGDMWQDVATRYHEAANAPERQ